MRVWMPGVVLVALAAAGCGEPAVHPVKGRVMLEGKPMKGGGSIAFMPVDGRPGKAAGGEIKEDGTYELMTHKPGDGSMAGEFRVVIHQSTDREPDATKDGEKAGRAVTVVGAADRIPAIYSDPARSPLKANVEGKANELDFDLKRDAGPPPVKGAMRPDVLQGPFAKR